MSMGSLCGGSAMRPEGETRRDGLRRAGAPRKRPGAQRGTAVLVAVLAAGLAGALMLAARASLWTQREAAEAVREMLARPQPQQILPQALRQWRQLGCPQRATPLRGAGWTARLRPLPAIPRIPADPPGPGNPGGPADPANPATIPLPCAQSPRELHLDIELRNGAVGPGANGGEAHGLAPLLLWAAVSPEGAAVLGWRFLD